MKALATVLAGVASLVAAPASGLRFELDTDRSEHVQHTSDDMAYQYIPAIAFYESTHAEIAQRQGFRIDRCNPRFDPPVRDGVDHFD